MDDPKGQNWWRRAWPGFLGGFVATLLLTGLLLGFGPRLLARGQQPLTGQRLEMVFRRSQVQQAMIDGLAATFPQDRQLQEKVLEQRLREQDTLVRHPDLSQRAMKLNLDLLERTARDDVEGSRLQALLADLFRRAADDPELRPELAAVTLELLRDPRALATLRGLIQAQAAPPRTPPPQEAPLPPQETAPQAPQERGAETSPAPSPPPP